MKKENIVDLIDYRQEDVVAQKILPMSDDLQQAIQSLIHRLRELGPLPH